MKQPQTRRRLRSRRRLFFFFALLVTAVLAYGTFIEPNRVELTTWQVTIPNLPADLDGLRVVQLSDLHRKPYIPDGRIRRAVNLANSTNPDIALLTGDFVSHNTGNAQPCAQMLSKLTVRHGLYAILGSFHDRVPSDRPILDSFPKHGIKMLVNNSVEAAPGLYVVGIDDCMHGMPNVRKAFAKVPDDAARVIMTHNPKEAPRMLGYSGFMTSGHVHGGQIALPFGLTRKMGPYLGRPYVTGWYEEGSILMYVNRGVGVSLFPVRLFSRPEVTLFILHPGKTLSYGKG